MNILDLGSGVTNKGVNKMVIAETLIGAQLVRSAVKGIKEVINTCEDISEIAHHIDNVFHGEEQVKRKIAAKKKAKQGKWYQFISQRLQTEDEGDGTSIQEIAQEVIEAKQIAKERHRLAIMLNHRFGSGTWATITKTRLERIEKLKARRKKEAELAKEKAWERKKFWKKTGEELGKVGIIILVIVGMYYYISYACKGCI
jgi:hypothetical protein